MKRFIPLILLVFILTACANKAQQGAAGGALAGATIGALTAGNKVQGAAIGAGAGLLLGYIIGNEWDKSDQQKLNSHVETAPSGQSTSWRNPDTGNYYTATPEPAYKVNGQDCRDVWVETRTPEGKIEKVKTQACRNPDGTWTMRQ